MRIAFLIVAILFTTPTYALEIENASKMPYQLDPAFIEEIWREVIRATNDEAPVMKITDDLKPPRIVFDPNYYPAPPGNFIRIRIIADITYYIDPKSGWAILDKPRHITLYRDAFLEYSSDLSKDPEFFPEKAYGAIAQEFFHEALFNQYVTPGYHHCAMIFRGTLEKVLSFIDQRLGTGSRITESLMSHTKGQCERDSGGKVKFPYRKKPE